MQCWRCESEAIHGYSLCESCAALPREKSARSEGSHRFKDHSAFEDSIESQNNFTKRAKKSPLISLCAWSAVILSALFVLFRDQSPVPMKGIEFSTSLGGKAEICKNKKGCIIVFLAPWCGACRSHVAFLNELQNSLRYKDLSLQIIVGGSKPKELYNFAQQISGTVLLDTENSFKSKLSFSSVPTWFSVDSSQTITNSFFPSYYEGDTPLAQLKYIVNKNAPELNPLVQ